MHELSIAMNILGIAEEESKRRGGVRVVAVHLKLGELSGVVKEALLSAFEIAREGSSLPDSKLIVEDVPIDVFCPRCDRETRAASPQLLQCVECGTPTGNVIRGRELEVAALEIVQ